uniref:coatomer subunit delta n=1 Tax=Myxine glutinosa TaxID=7769 RepID=UPI00358FBCE2
MVLLAAAVCTRAGRAIVSRHFVEVTRARAEGLLAAFPRLLGSGPGASTRQHTFVETDSVRYVYQPLEKLYVVLLTTKNSNILEDLETLRLFSRVVPEYCKVLEEGEIAERCFDLIFAFDEIVALGYRESVSLAQIRTFTDMDSHEEKVFKAVRETQEREAKAEMRKKAKELQLARREAERLGKKPPGYGNYGSSLGTTGQGMVPSAPAILTDMADTDRPKVSASSRSTGRAMKLGSRGKEVESFVEKLVSEGVSVAEESGRRRGAGSETTAPVVPAAHMDSVHLRVEEKLSVQCGRDGGLLSLEILGLISLHLNDEKFGKIQVMVANGDRKGAQLQTHPNVDRKLFTSSGVLTLKHADKSFPLHTDVGLLKWRLQSNDQALLPITINCWPSENAPGCDVNIEYELQERDLELRDVAVCIPLPSGSGVPVIAEVDGEYRHDARRGQLEWLLPLVDDRARSGSLEFSVANGCSTDFFPITVSFSSSQILCNIGVSSVGFVDSGAPVKFSSETSLLVDKYEIV